ncbi:MAG: long-chain fatty acid--CoA ligase, partial [Actinobacteria bacterium]|nr:long-chain fatty acid--CoA ligase [Actinomycetota bacterium]NIS29106.1 long-chain fatty acid--CoA ligase [Actinomycetota bacterium]NIT94343.1 long-chain fatty acid--CoA ligase [Actinomycetota bacterium]NIU17952.1 long-chain fatty acid--CoA ligase [Actinomycetota bacterium]NIU64512.1 long-chain fatty acid--CoA ligase [Actinomycetota bacterium]
SIRAFCAERLAGYKVPDAIAVVAEMPRGAMGKLLRPRLVDAATDAVSRSTPR